MKAGPSRPTGMAIANSRDADFERGRGIGECSVLIELVPLGPLRNKMALDDELLRIATRGWGCLSVDLHVVPAAFQRLLLSGLLSHSSEFVRASPRNCSICMAVSMKLGEMLLTVMPRMFGSAA